MRRALRLSFIEGLFSTVTVSLVDPFIVPAALALRAGNLAVALISGTGLLLSGLTHFLTPFLAAGVSSRRVLVIRFVRVQACACLLLAGAGFFGGWALALAIAAYALYCSAGSISFGLWASWMGDLVPRSGHSRYYALRSMVYGPVGGAVMLGLGLLFRSLWGEGSAPWQAFAAVFLAAGLLRIVASLVLRSQHEPAVRSEQTPPSDFTYWQFLRRAREGNFAAFAILFALLNGGSHLTGPFFATYVLRDLQCGYLKYVMFSVVLRLLPALGLIFLVKERVLRPSPSMRALIAELPAVRPAMEILRELMRPFSKSQG